MTAAATGPLETRTFHIGDILTITDGHLVSPRHIDGIYDLLGWMTGESLFTHQLPRASRECEADLRRQHPDLARVVVPDGMSSEDQVLAWLAEQVAVYGETREVTPLPTEDHTSIDPLTELRMMRPDADVIVVQPPDATGSQDAAP